MKKEVVSTYVPTETAKGIEKIARRNRITKSKQAAVALDTFVRNARRREKRRPVAVVESGN